MHEANERVYTLEGLGIDCLRIGIEVNLTKLTTTDTKAHEGMS